MDLFPTEDHFEIFTLDPLQEDIPWEALGGGKILFERIQAGSEGEPGFYLIDLDNKTTRGFMLSGNPLQPSLSPDGQRIACSMLTDLNSYLDIYIMNTDGTNCQPVYRGGYQDLHPTWMPGSSKIAYVGTQQLGALYTITAKKNASDRLEIIKFHYFDNENDWIIDPSGGFSASAGNHFTGVSYNKPEGVLMVTPGRGKDGVSVILPHRREDGMYYESPCFSPDGETIALLAMEKEPDGFLGGLWKSLSVYTIKPGGEELTRIVQVPAYEKPGKWSEEHRRHEVSLCWSPDGNKILFTVPTQENACNIYAVNADGTGLIQVTRNGKAVDRYVSWSR
jgi:Tol biopolymer transport system component